MVIDVGKGFLPPWLLPTLALPGVSLDPEISRSWLTLACAGAAVIGHCYPVWFDFKGGKGAATAIGALLCIAPGLVLPALFVWCLVVTTTGFVGLATMLAVAVLPVWVGLTQLPELRELFWFLVALALFIFFTHRGNIQRLREGRENRLEKAMLWRRPR
jgi:glycerol-3-phosphate acyltransferase PlsY